MIDKLGNQKHLVTPVSAVQKTPEVNMQEEKQEEKLEPAVRKPEKQTWKRLCKE